MVKQISEGARVPFNGFLLDKGEYDEYRRQLSLLEEIIDSVNSNSKRGNAV